MTPVSTATSGISVQEQRGYSQTGLVWMKKVPKEWQKLTIRAITTPKSERNKPDYQLLSVYRDYGVIPKNSRDDNFNRPGNDLNSYKAVMPGDLVLNKMKTWQGSLGISKHQGIVSPAYIVCKVSRNVNGDYLHHLLRSYPYIFEYNRLSYGVRENQWDMRYQDFKQIPLYLPDRPKQEAIVAFLESKLSQVDQYIANKRREIELLNEYKSSFISQVVTKGLDPNIEMKESGVEWIGKIPAHWSMKRLRYMATVNPSNLSTHNCSDDVQVSFLPMELIGTDGNLDTSNIKTYSAVKTGYTAFIDGDVIVAKITPCFENGKGALVQGLKNGIGYGTTELVVLRANKGLLPSFLYYVTHSQLFRKIGEIGMKGSAGQKRITDSFVKNYPFPVIPKDEQEEIVRYLDHKSAQIDALIHSTERSIEKMNMLRQSLIADAVTGKIDIPSAA